jgi:transcriptional regulator with XRE-family HTH domain
VTSAVRSLRTRLGDTQQKFAARIGSAISTVVRYELNRPPRGKVLAQLEKLASDHGFDEEAAVFRKALAQELGMPEPNISSRFPSPPKVELELQPTDEREHELIQDLLFAIRTAPDHEAAITRFEQQLRSTRRKKNQYRERVDSMVAQIFGAIRLRNSGETPEVVAAKFGAPVEAISMIFAAYAYFENRSQLDKPESEMRQLFYLLGLGMSDEQIAAELQTSIEVVRLGRDLQYVRILPRSPEAQS